MPANDEQLIKEFKRVLSRNAADGFVNLDGNFSEKFDFFLQPVEEVLRLTGFHIAPNRWSYHRLVLITEGMVDYTCGIYKYKAVKNTLVIIPARTITTSEWHPDTKGFITLFSLDFFIANHFAPTYLEKRTILQPTMQPFIHLTDEQAVTVKQAFENILKERNGQDPIKDQIIAVKLAELLLIVDRICCQTEESMTQLPALGLVKQFADEVEQHFRSEKSVSFYAARLNVHPNYLNSVIRANTGFTAKESIQNRLILEAKYLLRNTSLSIKEIAHQIGFADPNYFGVFFKRSEHNSPALYRSS